MGYVKEQWMLGNNPDPKRFEDVHTKGGWYRREKRKKGTKVNPVLKKNVHTMTESLAAADRLIAKLDPWVRDLELVTVRMNIAANFTKRYNITGKADFMLMKGLDLQPYRKLDELLRAPYRVDIVKDEVIIKIDVGERSLELTHSIATEFYFDAVILWGNPMEEKGLRVDGVESKLYSIKSKKAEKCVLRLDLPGKKMPWMVLLKVSCLEGNELAINTRHYGMKIVEVGGNIE